MANYTPGFIAGHFSASYAARSGNNNAPEPIAIGGYSTISTSIGGLAWRRAPQIQPITIDEFGQMLVAGIHQGIESYLNLQYIDYAAMRVALEALVGDSSSAGATLNMMTDQIGRTILRYAGSLKLTPVDATASGLRSQAFLALNGQSIIFPRAVIDTDVESMLSTKVRTGPATFHCYPEPYDTTNRGKVWYLG